jgi:hypothetical protein
MRSTRTVTLFIAVSVMGAAGARSQPSGVLKFWNLASSTITKLYIAPLGTAHWSSNLCLSDPDHAVDPDERLAMVGVKSGKYNVRVVDKDKRACLFHNVLIRPNGPYALSISEDEMRMCALT